MQKNTIWTIVLVIAAIVVAWIIVEVLGSLLWFVFKLLIVAAVAVGVYLVLRALFARSSR